MNITKMAFVTMVFSVCLFVASSFGADVAKIGVVDFQTILEKSDASLKKKGQEIDETKKKLEREALVMSKEKRDEKEREIRISTNDLKILQNKYTTDLRQLEAKLVRDIQKEVVEIITKIGKKEGFLVIFEKREAGVLYSPDTIDITDRLIQDYNSIFSKKASKKK